MIHRRRLLLMFSFLIALMLIGVGCGEKEEKTASTPAKPAPAPSTSPASTPPATTKPSTPASGEVLAQGEKLFVQSCSACHGPKGEGVPNLGKDLTASAFVKGLSDDELLAFIKKGRPSFDPANTTRLDMPPKGGNPALTDDQLKAIITYMRTLEK